MRYDLQTKLSKCAKQPVLIQNRLAVTAIKLDGKAAK
jgi:hypothetical protein